MLLGSSIPMRRTTLHTTWSWWWWSLCLSYGITICNTPNFYTKTSIILRLCIRSYRVILRFFLVFKVNYSVEMVLYMKLRSLGSPSTKLSWELSYQLRFDISIHRSTSNDHISQHTWIRWLINYEIKGTWVFFPRHNGRLFFSKPSWKIIFQQAITEEWKNVENSKNHRIFRDGLLKYFLATSCTRSRVILALLLNHMISHCLSI